MVWIVFIQSWSRFTWTRYREAQHLYVNNTFLSRQNLHLDYIIERECLVNKFITVPKDKGKELIKWWEMENKWLFSLGNLNCASFVAGIVEGILCTSGFVCSFSSAFLLNERLLSILAMSSSYTSRITWNDICHNFWSIGNGSRDSIGYEIEQNLG